MLLRVGWMVVFSMFAGYAAGQTAAVNPASTPVYHAKAQMVLADVAVTDKKGQPVTGLNGQDFEVSENGHRQDVTYFQQHPVKRQQPMQSLPPQPPDVFTNLPTGPMPDALDVLLIDTLNTPLVDQTFVRQQVIKYLKRLPPGARIAIFTMSVRLGFIQGFTSDPAVLLAALAKSELDPQFSPLLKTDADQVADQQAIHQMQELATTQDSASFQATVNAMTRFLGERDATRTQQRVGITLHNLQELGRYLAGVPGRKNVVWFSGSFPINIFPSATGNSILNLSNAGEQEALIGQTATDASPQFFHQQLAETAELLDASRVSLYPVNARGLDTNSFYDADIPPSNPGVPESQRQSTALSNEEVERDARNATMDELADQTGGKAFYNTNGLGQAMADVIKNGEYFYTLAYSPSDKNMDGKFRRIKIKVNTGNYKLSYRRGYYATDKQQLLTIEAGESSDPLREYMALGMPDFDQILYKVLVQPIKAANASDKQPSSAQQKNPPQWKGPVADYDINFAVPVEDIQFVLTPDGVRHGSVNVSIFAYNSNGVPIFQQSKVITMNIQPALYATFQQRGLQLRESIRLPKAELWLRTGIYDPASARVGTLEIPMSAVTDPAVAADKSMAK
ncbi:MAG: VWA domain-containing protein [Silvibacterium sp.]